MRVLTIGGGQRVLALTKLLRDEGDVVRVVTRKPERFPEIEAVGGEPVLGDPDRVGTLRQASDHVTLFVIALGNVDGGKEAALALHTDRLEMLLERAIDTTVRGILYERVGGGPNAVDQDLLDAGAEIVRKRCEFNQIPFAFIDHDPTDVAGWATATRQRAYELFT